MSNVLDFIYCNREFFFWTMFQKMDTSLDMLKIIERVNTVNSKHFKVIENDFQTLADPFLFKYGKDMYVFFEKINNDRWIERLNEGTGEIYSCKLIEQDGILSFSKPILVLKEEHHLSYPVLIRDMEDIYMLPEQRKSGRLELYKCISFPNKWENVKTLLDGNFIDSTIFYYNSIYWLFTISTNRKNTEFKEQLYYSEKLVTKNWKLHSTIRVTNKIESRRGAGNIIMKDGKIYRPIQNNRDYYGQGILFLEITKLSITEYEEKPVGIINRNIHTFNMLDNWIVIDSHNKNKNFFELDYQRSFSRWTSKNNRKRMIKYYNEIGNWLRDIESKNVLDIGINMFNIYNKSYFNNENINYYQMDISVCTELAKKLESTVIVDNFIELEKRHPEYINWFDVIISYGVLGYVEFTYTQIMNYLMTAYTLLKKNGRLYLKLDKKHMLKTFNVKNIVKEEYLSTYFKSVNAVKIAPEYILDDEHIFYVLVRK